jgi:alkyldihydroxyacetonephosphate synthase
MDNFSKEIDWSELINEIGEEVVSLDETNIAAHSYDVWPVATKWRRQGKQPHRPDAVVRPNNPWQVSKVLMWANRRNIPITPWGQGSSVTGASLPLRGGITLDMSAMEEIIDLNECSLYVSVQAGILGSDLELYLNDHGYTLNHSPQSLYRSTVGGWVSTLASGQFSSRWGSIEDLVLGLQVVLPTGEMVEKKLIPRASIGPDFFHLFLGAEGTLGVITAVTLKIFPLPESRLFETVVFTNIESGIEVMRVIMRSGLRPFLVRFYDADETPYIIPRMETDANAMLLGFEGVESIVKAEHGAAVQICQDHGGILLGPESAKKWMRKRFDFSLIENRLEQDGGLAETIEVAHFWDSILETYYALKNGLQPFADQILGHFSHVYPQGISLYMILLGQADGDEKAEAQLMEIWETAMRVSLEKGAAISHHHGIGIARLPYIREELGGMHMVLQKMKNALDPKSILNPGKLGLEK